MDRDLKDKNNFKQRDLINAFKNKESFHLNSLITKNISLFTKNHNYKMLTWMIVQLTIFSLFIDNTLVDVLDLVIFDVFFCSFCINKIFPYVQSENPINMGNNDLKFIKI